MFWLVLTTTSNSWSLHPALALWRNKVGCSIYIYRPNRGTNVEGKKSRLNFKLSLTYIHIEKLLIFYTVAYFFIHFTHKNSYFIHWNFDWKICFVVFFLEWKEWKNPQFNFSSQNLSIERNFFQMRWKRNQEFTPTFP